jgi:hypothetical protein
MQTTIIFTSLLGVVLATTASTNSDRRLLARIGSSIRMHSLTDARKVRSATGKQPAQTDLWNAV